MLSLLTLTVSSQSPSPVGQASHLPAPCARRPENAARSVRRTLSAPYPVARSAPRNQRQCEHFASRRAGTEHRSKPPGGAPPSASALGPAPILGFRRARATIEPALAVRTPGGRPCIPGASDRRPIRRADPLRACAPDLSTRSTPPARIRGRGVKPPSIFPSLLHVSRRRTDP